MDASIISSREKAKKKQNEKALTQNTEQGREESKEELSLCERATGSRGRKQEKAKELGVGYPTQTWL
jgi:sulfur relay (sulfurtransferase) complex TusBCD TusD component (DsrE family)